MDRRELLLTLPVLGVAAATAATATAGEKDLILVVTDPLSSQLSCPCVEGYAQRDYDKLGAFLTEKLGRPVKVHFSESLAGALQKKTDGKADVIIGKDSVVRADAKAAKIGLQHLAALTGKDGATTQKGCSRPQGRPRPHGRRAQGVQDPLRAGQGRREARRRADPAEGPWRPRPDRAGDMRVVQRRGYQGPRAAQEGGEGRDRHLQLRPAAPRRARDDQEGGAAGHRRDGRGPFIAAFANDQLSASDRETIKTASSRSGSRRTCAPS